MKPTKIIQITLENIDVLAPLFSQYRQFITEKISDAEACKNFLAERITNNESIIFLAIDETEEQSLGFVQLYPCFSSIALEKIWILNDLFVSCNARGQGLAKKLIQHSIEFLQQSGANRIELKTENNNITAQKLYEKLEFYKQDGFTHYWWIHKEAYPVRTS